VLQIFKVYIWQYDYLLCEKNIHVGKKNKKIIIMEINMGWARSVSNFVGSKKWIRARPFLSIKTRYFSSDQPVTRPTTTQQSNYFSVSSDSDRFGNFCPPLPLTITLTSINSYSNHRQWPIRLPLWSPPLSTTLTTCGHHTTHYHFDHHSHPGTDARWALCELVPAHTKKDEFFL
jgi:hypothetical protein